MYDYRRDFHSFYNAVEANSLYLIELESIDESMHICLTDKERIRLCALGKRRKKSYIGSRIALKRLAKKIGIVSPDAKGSTIETLAMDGIRPCLPQIRGRERFYCSVSHNNRFVIAVADSSPLGVDVELISSKILEGKHLFMSLSEWNLVSSRNYDLSCAATRIWTIKEAAAKALGMLLPDAWNTVEVIRIGYDTSWVQTRKNVFPVFHAQIQNHLFSIMNSSQAKFREPEYR